MFEEREVIVPLCVHCDKPTKTAPCEHCGVRDVIGTRMQAREALIRRGKSQGNVQVCVSCGRCPDHCPCSWGGVHVPGNYGDCVECNPARAMVPPVPPNGWTVGSLRQALLYYPKDTPIKVFTAFDTEGPESWENPRIRMDQGVLKIES